MSTQSQTSGFSFTLSGFGTETLALTEHCRRKTFQLNGSLWLSVEVWVRVTESNPVKTRKPSNPSGSVLGPICLSLSRGFPSHNLQALEWLSLVEPRILLFFLLVFRSWAGRDSSSSLFLRSQSGSCSSSNSPLWRWFRHSGSALQREQPVSVGEGTQPALALTLLPEHYTQSRPFIV